MRVRRDCLGDGYRVTSRVSPASPTGQIEGNRVIIVVAAMGGLGELPVTGLGSRLEELRASAGTLGVSEVVDLGYADSGHGSVLFPDPPDRVRFARADLEEAAAKLAGLIRDAGADLLLSYDSQGGYGHRDHVKVHQVGARAAELAGVRVLEATLPRELITWLSPALRLLRLVTWFDLGDPRTSFSPRSAITHRVDVRRYAAQKQAALTAHRSQVSGRGSAGHLFRALTALPAPLYGLICGREWFVEPGAAKTTVRRDILRPA